MTSHRFFKMAATWQFYFRFRFWWLRSIRKVEIYLRAKFRWHFSIHCWDITTSSFLKQTSAVLIFYFRFRFSRLRHHRHVILHPTARFCPNRVIRDIGLVMKLYLICMKAATASQFYFRFRFFVTSLIWEGRSLPADQLSARYLDPRLRYYYFWFLKTNVRHVETLLSVSISMFASHRHVILHLPAKFRPNRTIRDIVMASYQFFKMAATTASQFYFRFRFFRDFTSHLGRPKSTGRPNFGEISQSMADILLLPVSENNCPQCWNSTSGFDFHLVSSPPCHSASAYQISSKSDPQRWS